MEFEITPDSWVKTRHKLRKAYMLTEKSYPGVKLLDIICSIIAKPNGFGEVEPKETTGLQIGYQVIAEVNGQIVRTTGFWEEIVGMDQHEVDDEAMARVSEWVMALRILEGKLHKQRG
jgi:hypothetical protein